MKLPSIIKIPSYQRFNFEPRHYDPIKEDIDGRVQRIKRIIAVDKKTGKFSSRERLAGAFERRVPHDSNSPFLRLIIGVILFSGVVGFLYFGNIAIYITSAIVLGYMVLKKVVFK